MRKTITISLPEDIDERLRLAVKKGGFSSNSRFVLHMFLVWENLKRESVEIRLKAREAEWLKMHADALTNPEKYCDEFDPKDFLPGSDYLKGIPPGN